MQRVQECCVLLAATISIALLLVAPALGGQDRFVFIPRADSPGNDYLKVDNSSFDDCVRRCDAHSACNAFTYNQRHGVCFLKRSANRSTTFYAFAVTGIKLSPSLDSTNLGANRSAGSADAGSSFLLFSQTDSPGNDYSRIDGSSYETCRNGCAALTKDN
jgi:serine protease Do